MKKITFFIFLFVSSLGFSQELLTDGDFESGAAAPNWTGNGAGANVVDDGSGSNFVNAALVGAAAEGWQTSLQQVVPMTQGQAYALSFDAYVDAGTATMKAGLGQNGGAFSSAGTDATETLTTTSTNFSYTFTPSYDTVANGARVFFDMGGTANDGITIFIDNVSLMETTAAPSCTDGIMNGDETGVDCGGSCPNACTPDAPDPSNADAEVVLSLFNDVPGYTNQYTAEGEFGTRTVVDLSTTGTPDEATKMDFSIDSWGQFNNTTVDVSGASFINFNYYAPTMAPGTGGHEFYIMVNSGSGEKFYTFKADASGDDTITFDSWQNVSIPMTFFTAQGFDPTTFLVWKLGTPSTDFSKVVYFDNIFFGTNALSDTDFMSLEFNVFPNPTTTNWNISSSSIINNVVVYDILGKQSLVVEPRTNKFSIDAATLNSGIYFARIESANGSKTVKLIKE